MDRMRGREREREREGKGDGRKNEGLRGVGLKGREREEVMLREAAGPKTLRPPKQRPSPTASHR